MFATSADVLNISIAFGFVILVIFLSIMVFYAILILRDISKVVEDVEDVTNRVRTTIVEPLKAVDFLVEKVRPYVESLVEMRSQAKKSSKKSK